jgi:parvulin-like peptidyl-prolyl isomerase
MPATSRRFAAFTWTGLAFAPFLTTEALAQQPAPKNLPAAVSADPNRRVVAYFHSNVPVHRDELGDYLIARGGMDKLELLVNRRMIEVAATRAGVGVTPEEIDAGLEADLVGSKADLAAFTQYIKERYGKSVFEWKQDVIRPRLLIGKMCQKSILVTPEDMQKTYESVFGEKRQAQLIVWPKGADGKPNGLTPEQMAKARATPADFEKLAANQPDEKLQQSGGLVNPVGRHIDGEDPNVEKALFTMKEGEISPWIETKTNFTCLRCVRIVPADPMLTFDKVKGEVEKEVRDRKMTAAIPGKFAEIKKDANPQLTVHVPMPDQFDPKNPPVRVQEADPRVLAYVYKSIPITRDDLGDFLIVRGGFEKIELLVNKRLIEWECAKRGISVTPEEVKVAKKEYVDKLGIENVTVDDFVKHVLPKRNMTATTWVEDVIVPELLMTKLCRERVKETPEDLQKAFDNKYGEKRAAKVILWRRDEARIALNQWDQARKSDAEFDSIARQQFDKSLASRSGQVEPIGKYPDAESSKIADTVFQLKVGEVSQLFETPAGIICVKCTGIVPANTKVKLDDVKVQLSKDVFERKLAKELGVCFAEMKEAAKPTILLRGPTTYREFEEGNRQLIQQADGRQPK